MNKKEIEHRERLKVLENTMGTTYYETGHLHLAISDAMEKYHKDKLNLLTIQRVTNRLNYWKYIAWFGIGYMVGDFVNWILNGW